MNLYFFYKNQSTDSWYNCTIEAWEENDNTYKDGKRISNFSMLEELHIHVSKHPDQYHSAKLIHDRSANSCMGHHAKSKKDFIRDKTENNYSCMIETNHKTFQRLKKVMLKIYSSYPEVNYTKHLLQDAPACRIL